MSLSILLLANVIVFQNWGATPMMVEAMFGRLPKTFLLINRHPRFGNNSTPDLTEIRHKDIAELFLASGPISSSRRSFSFSKDIPKLGNTKSETTSSFEQSGPSITKEPTSTNALLGGTVTFYAEAMGTEPLSIQWQFNGRTLLGATNSFLTLTNVTSLNEGHYIFSVSNMFGLAESRPAQLTVNAPPSVKSIVEDRESYAGTNMVVKITALGSGLLTYQWLFREQPIEGAIYPSLVLTNIQSWNTGLYSVAVSNAFGVVTNAILKLTVKAGPPIILSQPLSTKFHVSGDATLRVFAGGSDPRQFQWWQNGLPIPGATNSVLSLTNLHEAGQGNYVVTITNVFGGVESSPAFLSIGNPFGTNVDWPALGFERVSPYTFEPLVGIQHSGDGSGRLFIIEQIGKIQIIQSNDVLSSPFLDITDRVLFGRERGLLGLAFSRGFKTNGQFYVYYTRRPDGAAVISRFRIGSDLNAASTNSEQVLLTIPQPYDNHNGGHLAFGRDGYLYIGTGDGGYINFADPNNSAQNPASFLGKLLRIHVETGTTPYSIPLDNPFVGKTNYLPEIWALGLRNPWRFSFDRENGDLYIGDVGHNMVEEINFQSGNSPGGQNYGWSVREGNRAFRQLPDSVTSPFTEPIVTYSHQDGRSITGGYVYRGPYERRMSGVYFYADYVTGKIWGLKNVGSNWISRECIKTLYGISTFGEDEEGRLYLADYRTRRIYRMADTKSALQPVILPPGGQFDVPQSVVITSESPDAKIYFTTDGREPTEFDSVVPSGGQVQVQASSIIKARAFRNDLLPSAVSTATFLFHVGNPVFSPSAGPITNGTQIEISTTTPDAVIHYTLDGSDPDRTTKVYSGPFAINGNTLIRAAGYKDGYRASEITATYFDLVKVAKPVFVPAGGFITNSTPISLSASTERSTIRYTLDGSDPTLDSPEYTQPVIVNAGTQLKARAFRDDLAPSDIETVTYALLHLPNLEYTPAPGLATNGTKVTISLSASEVTIRYTLDGTDPTPDSPLYTEPVVLTANQTLKAFAYKKNYGDSPVQSGRYDLWVPEKTIVTTIAGTGTAGWQDGPGVMAMFRSPEGICLDLSGNIYVTDTGNHLIRCIDPNGMVTTLAGNGSPGFNEGHGTNAQFNVPVGIAFWRDYQLYIADRMNWRIRRVTTGGEVTTYAGSGKAGDFDSNNSLLRSQFRNMSHITADNFLLVCTPGKIRKLHFTDIMHSASYFSDYQAGNPSAVTDGQNQFWIVSSAGAVEKLTSHGLVEIYAGGYPSGYVDGPLLDSKFPDYPESDRSILRDKDGNFFVSDPYTVRKINTNGIVSTLAGCGLTGNLNGKGNTARFHYIAGLALDSKGDLYVVDSGNHSIRKIWMDHDDDGIPDSLEGKPTPFILGVKDTLVDSDNDGMNNAAEFHAGTDPQNATSFLAVESLQILEDNRVQLRWHSVIGKRYVVKYTENLTDWITLVTLRSEEVISKVIDPGLARTLQKRIYRVFVDEN